MNIGRKVREVREDIGMPRAELARRIGMSETNMLRIESGQRQPSIRSLELIASALRTEPSQLLEPAGKEPALPKHSAPTPEAGQKPPERIVAVAGPADEGEEGLAPTLEYVNGVVDRLIAELREDGVEDAAIALAMNQKASELAANR
jgi:transcriptional regulator with XRE-family HTH domain